MHPSVAEVTLRFNQIKDRLLLRKANKPITCPRCTETLAVSQGRNEEHWLCPNCGWDMHSNLQRVETKTQNASKHQGPPESDGPEPGLITR